MKSEYKKCDVLQKLYVFFVTYYKMFHLKILRFILKNYINFKLYENVLII
jgi:hypothetical protein